MLAEHISRHVLHVLLGLLAKECNVRILRLLVALCETVYRINESVRAYGTISANVPAVTVRRGLYMFAGGPTMNQAPA